MVDLVIKGNEEKASVGKCLIATQRFSSGRLVVAITDFVVNTENTATMQESLDLFKKLNENLLAYEKAVNEQTPTEAKKN